MTTAWRLDHFSDRHIESSSRKPIQTTSGQYGEWTLAKAKPTPLSRPGFKPITSHEDVGSVKLKDEWKPRLEPLIVDKNNNNDISVHPASKQQEKVFQRVKPLDFSQTKFSPRQTKGINSDGVSSASAQVQSEPMFGNESKVDLTSEHAFGVKGQRKQVNFAHNISLNPEAMMKKPTVLNSLNTRNTRSPKAGRRAIIPQEFEAFGQNNFRQIRPTFSPRGSRKLLDSKAIENSLQSAPKTDAGGPQTNVFLDTKTQNPQTNSENSQGATTDWSLTKYEIASGFPPRNSNAQVIAKVSDPSGHPMSGRYLDPIPALQRSHTFDYSDRRNSGSQPPSWQNKLGLISAGSQMSQEDDPAHATASNNRNWNGKPSPKLGRRLPNHWNESYMDTSSIQSIKSEELVRKPGTPIFKSANYMYKNLEQPTELKHNVTSYNVFQQNDQSLFDTASTNTSKFNNQLQSISNKATDPTEFDYDDNLYTIAERSRENSRPTSTNGSDANSLDDLTSASHMNGVTSTSTFSIDLTAGDQQFPGKHQTPKKSILKKAGGLASAHYDLTKVFAAGSIEAPKHFTHALLTDEQISLTNSHSEKRRVTFNV